MTTVNITTKPTTKELTLNPTDFPVGSWFKASNKNLPAIYIVAHWKVGEMTAIFVESGDVTTFNEGDGLFDRIDSDCVVVTVSLTSD